MKLDHNVKYKFLDFAPTRLLSEWIKGNEFIEYRSADLYMENVDDKVDIQNMMVYDSNSFDYILCSHVLEQVENDSKAAKEIYRVLKNGGKALIMVPIQLCIEETLEDKNITEPDLRWKYYG